MKEDKVEKELAIQKNEPRQKTPDTYRANHTFVRITEEEALLSLSASKMLFAALGGTQGTLSRCLRFSDGLEIPLKQLRMHVPRGCWWFFSQRRAFF